MPTIKVNALGGKPLFDIGSYARRGPGRRDRLSPAELATISRTVRRAPEVMVKVLPKGATQLASVRRHLDYVSRDGALALETEEGVQLHLRNDEHGFLEQWDLDLDVHRRSLDVCASEGRKPARLVHKLVLSMPAGSDPQGVLRASRDFLTDVFGAKHRYAFVLHTDQPHPHVHVVIKAISEQGVRLNIDKSTLRQWREAFAGHLRAQGIEAHATERAVRGQDKPIKHDAIFRAARRGSSTHMRDRVDRVVRELASGTIRAEAGKQKLLETRRQVEAGWLSLVGRLQEEGRTGLAQDALRFVRQMKPPRTEKEWIAQEILRRTREPITRELPKSR